MVPAPTPVHSDEHLPGRASVVVIGGGIAGVSTALELAERGIDVVLCEKGIIAGEQSSRNWGWCRRMGRDPREIELMCVAMELWRGMNNRVAAETGFVTSGLVYACDTEAKFAARQHWLQTHARPNGLDARVLTGRQTKELLAGSSLKWAGGLYMAGDGAAEPQLAAPAMAEAARRHGCRIFTGCAVRGIEKSAGRISGVVTEKGTIACDSVVLAGGAWSRRFCGNHQIDLPQLSVISSVMCTKPIDAGLTVSASGGHFGFRKRRDGGYTIANSQQTVSQITPDSFRLFFDFLPILKMEWRGVRLRLGRHFVDAARMARFWQLDQVSPFEQVRILDPQPVKDILEQAGKSLKLAFPVFASMQVAEQWAGFIDVTPDAVPVISPVETMPGLFIATGFSGHGFGIGPAAGRLMADLVTGETPVVNPAAFRHSRFTDGSNPQPIVGT